MNDDDIYNAFADAYVKETLSTKTALNHPSSNVLSAFSSKNKKSNKKSSKLSIHHSTQVVDTTKGLFGGLTKESDIEE